MPIGKVPTEELLMEGTRSGGSYGEVSSQQDHRSKHYSSRSKHHNHNYTRYSPRCKYHSPRHTLSKEIECIANMFYQKSPAPCSRHRLFHQKRCIVDGNIATAPFLCTRHKVFLQKEYIADKMTRIPPISSSRYRFFPPKECVADRNTYPKPKCHRDTWKLTIKGVSQTENITSASFSARDTRYFSKKGVSRIGTVPWLLKDWQSRNTLNPYIIES